MEPIPEKLLPGCGIMVNNGEAVPMLAAWLYMDNSVGVAWLAWLVSRPGANGNIDEALGYLQGAAEAILGKLDYHVLITMAEKRSLKKWYETHGWQKNLDHETSYVRNF